MKTLSAIGILLLFISIGSCKKEQDTAAIIPVINFSKEALAFAQLPLNRYFIYKDSATGKLDSVVVNVSSLTTILVPERAATSLFMLSRQAYYAQRFKLMLILYNSIRTSWYDVTDDALANVNLLVITSTDSHALTLGGYDNFLPSNNYISSIGFSYDPKYPAALQSLAVEGTNYNDVLACVTSNGADADSTQSWYYKSIYYWVKGVGIIKRTGKTNKGTITSNLLRYGG